MVITVESFYHSGQTISRTTERNQTKFDQRTFFLLMLLVFTSESNS